MIKEIPILFSTPMVQAILEGRKTQTRRIPIETISIDKMGNLIMGKWNYGQHLDRRPQFENLISLKSRWKIRDILWVRETWRGIEQDFGPDRIEYKASESINIEGKWKPSIHMPKVAARIWLQVESVRVERLQDISEEDAKAEGVRPNCEGIEKCPSQYCQRMGCQSTGEYYHYQRDLDDFPAFSAKESFESLWQSINGVKSWNENPWVWVITFKVLSTTGKPDLQSSK